MTASTYLGFLTVVDCGSRGFIGGLLVLNHLGRPIEFHCSVPVIPNRAQEILYGPTLRPHLFGEQIGGTLLSRAKQKPKLVLTDELDVLNIIHAVDLPVVLIDDGGDLEIASLIDERKLIAVQAGAVEAYLSQKQATLATQLSKLVVDVDDEFDLEEPFQRIREAIDEAQKAA